MATIYLTKQEALEYAEYANSTAGRLPVSTYGLEGDDCLYTIKEDLVWCPDENRYEPELEYFEPVYLHAHCPAMKMLAFMQLEWEIESVKASLEVPF